MFKDELLIMVKKIEVKTNDSHQTLFNKILIIPDNFNLPPNLRSHLIEGKREKKASYIQTDLN